MIFSETFVTARSATTEDNMEDTVDVEHPTLRQNSPSTTKTHIASANAQSRSHRPAAPPKAQASDSHRHPVTRAVEKHNLELKLMEARNRKRLLELQLEKAKKPMLHRLDKTSQELEGIEESERASPRPSVLDNPRECGHVDLELSDG